MGTHGSWCSILGFGTPLSMGSWDKGILVMGGHPHPAVIFGPYFITSPNGYRTRESRFSISRWHLKYGGEGNSQLQTCSSMLPKVWLPEWHYCVWYFLAGVAFYFGGFKELQLIMERKEQLMTAAGGVWGCLLTSGQIKKQRETNAGTQQALLLVFYSVRVYRPWDATSHLRTSLYSVKFLWRYSHTHAQRCVL